MKSLLQSVLESRLISSTGIYSIAGVLNGSVIFFLLPILTRVLDQEQYGLLSMFRVLVAFTFPFIGFYASINRQYYERESIDFPEYLSTCLTVILTHSVIVGGVLILVGDFVAELTAFPTQWMWCVVLFAIGKALMQVVLVIWQVQLMSVKYGIFQIAQSVLMFVMAVTFVVYFEWGWLGGIWADTLSMAIFGLTGLYFLRKEGWFRVGFNMAYARDILDYNVPLIFHAVSRSIITMSDRIFITSMVGLHDTGLYAAGYQVGMVMFIISSSFNNAWTPYFYGKLKEDDQAEKEKLVKFTYIYFSVLVAIALALGFIAPWFVSIFLGGQFADSYLYVKWIAIGFAFNGMYWVMSGYIFYLRKTRIIAYITVMAAILNIAFNYGLITLNGAIGAAQATALTFLIVLCVTWLVSRKLYPMPWKVAA